MRTFTGHSHTPRRASWWRRALWFAFRRAHWRAERAAWTVAGSSRPARLDYGHGARPWLTGEPLIIYQNEE